jgi:formate dehydrogenase subunit beta
MTIAADIQSQARDLLESGRVAVVIGYEVDPRGRIRPTFVRTPQDAERLVWNEHCSHNLTVYLREHLRPDRDDTLPRAAIVAKPCDSRTINVLLGENAFERSQLHVIGVACDGMRDGESLQARCHHCEERLPVVADTLLGEPPEVEELSDPVGEELARLEALPPSERLAFWLDQFDRCIRCYACRQACPLCSCPTCLYERDDSLWVGMGAGLDEKRTFHLGRAYHLAGRCVGCNECERVCPMNIPISLLNRKLAKEVEVAFGYRAGLAPVPSPITTVLGSEEA